MVPMSKSEKEKALTIRFGPFESELLEHLGRIERGSGADVLRRALTAYARELLSPAAWESLAKEIEPEMVDYLPPWKRAQPAVAPLPGKVIDLAELLRRSLAAQTFGEDSENARVVSEKPELATHLIGRRLEQMARNVAEMQQQLAELHGSGDEAESESSNHPVQRKRSRRS